MNVLVERSGPVTTLIINRFERRNAINEETARFPQVCLRNDRMSCHRQWDLNLFEALRNEGIGGERPQGFL